jgi:hypothetical protein
MDGADTTFIVGTPTQSLAMFGLPSSTADFMISQPWEQSNDLHLPILRRVRVRHPASAGIAIYRAGPCKGAVSALRWRGVSRTGTASMGVWMDHRRRGGGIDRSVRWGGDHLYVPCSILGLRRDKMTDHKPTIYEALTARLGREPTGDELRAEMRRISDEALVEAAAAGKLRFQRGGRRA